MDVVLVPRGEISTCINDLKCEILHELLQTFWKLLECPGVLLRELRSHPKQNTAHLIRFSSDGFAGTRNSELGTPHVTLKYTEIHWTCSIWLHHVTPSASEPGGTLKVRQRFCSSCFSSLGRSLRDHSEITTNSSQTPTLLNLSEMIQMMMQNA